MKELFITLASHSAPPQSRVHMIRDQSFPVRSGNKQGRGNMKGITQPPIADSLLRIILLKLPLGWLYI